MVRGGTGRTVVTGPLRAERPWDIPTDAFVTAGFVVGWRRASLSVSPLELVEGSKATKWRGLPLLIEAILAPRSLYTRRALVHTPRPLNSTPPSPSAASPARSLD